MSVGCASEYTLRTPLAAAPAGFTQHFSKPLNFDHLHQYLNSVN